MIRYELEVASQTRHCPPVEILEEFSRMPEIAKRSRPKGAFESDSPMLHPGRVLVSSQVMTRLGRYEVLHYLNLFVRGGWEDGAYAGAMCYDQFYNDRTLDSVYRIGEQLSLLIKTNALRTVTVIRFQHERLWVRRWRAAKEEEERTPSQSLPYIIPIPFDAEDIPF